MAFPIISLLLIELVTGDLNASLLYSGLDAIIIFVIRYVDVFCSYADPTIGSIIYVNKLSHGSRPCPLDPDPGEKIPIEIY